MVKSLDQAPRESEARFNRTPEFGKVVSWEWDVATGELLWSDHAYRLFGEEPGRMLPSYDVLLQRIHPEDRTSFQPACDRALAVTSPFDLDFRIMQPSGAVRLLQSRCEVLRDRDLRVALWAG